MDTDLNIARLKMRELERRYLLELYKLSNRKQFALICKDQIISSLGITDDEWRDVQERASDKGLVKRNSFETVQITELGIEETEKIMSSDYEKQLYLVLKKVTEDCRYNGGMERSEVAKLLSIGAEDLDNILFDFKEKGWVKLTFSSVEATPAGINAFNKWEERNQQPQNISGNINNFTFNASVTGFQNQTQNSVQNLYQVNITNDFDFNAAMEAIISLIRESSISNFKKEDLISDLERIKNLAETEPSKELVEHAKSRINYLETALKGTELAAKLAPYIPQLYAYFEGLVR